jgi:hypothetical protein
MTPAPRDYSPEYCDAKHSAVYDAITDIKRKLDKFDTRMWLMVLSALGQAGALIVGLIIAFVKFG